MSIESNMRSGSVSFKLAYQWKIISIFDNSLTIGSPEVNKFNVNGILQVFSINACEVLIQNCIMLHSYSRV